MTEAEWLSCTDPAALLTDLSTERKQRLFACACARRVWHLMADERSRKAAEASEAFADDTRLVFDLRHAHKVAEEVIVPACRAWSEANEEYGTHLVDDAPDNEGAESTAEDGYHAYAALVAASDARAGAEVGLHVAAYRLQLADLLARIRRAMVGSSPGATEEAEKVE
jgi:hypothetical protein